MLRTDIAEMNRSADLLSIVSSNTYLKRISNCEGGEFAGPCPFCGGRDRFRIQPFHAGGPRWFCRGCGENHWHSPIDYIIRRNNCDFTQALQILSNIQPGSHYYRQGNAGPNLSAWISAANEFCLKSKAILHTQIGIQVQDWLHKRGLTNEAIDELALGYNPNDHFEPPDKWGFTQSKNEIYIPRGIVIPNIDQKGIHAIKVRRSNGKPKYMLIRGSTVWVYGGLTIRRCRTAFLFESELDALLAYGTGFDSGYLALPATQNLRMEYEYIFHDLEKVIIMPDNDDPGMKNAKRLAILPGFVLAPILPIGKDLTEYYQAGGSIENWLSFCNSNHSEAK